jgi:hypothetical protein
MGTDKAKMKGFTSISKEGWKWASSKVYECDECGTLVAAHLRKKHICDKEYLADESNNEFLYDEVAEYNMNGEGNLDL